MWKKLCVWLAAVVLTFAVGCTLVACGNDTAAAPDSGIGQTPGDNGAGQDTPGDDTAAPQIKITGVTFDDMTVPYDRQPHTIEVSGVLPQGVRVDYSGNTATVPGTYNATATLSGEGYETLTLTATLIVTPLTIQGVTFDDMTVPYDGQAHSLEIVGILPEGVSVRYENATHTDAGVHEAKAVLSGVGYTTLTLTAALRITVSEKERAVQFADGKLYFANALDGDKLYSYSADGLQKVSSDVPYDFSILGDTVYFRSKSVFSSRIKAIGENGVDAVASEKGEYLCNDGTYLYFVSNGLTNEKSGIYKLDLRTQEPTVTLLSQGKAKYMIYNNRKLYFADGANGDKLSSIPTNGSTSERTVVVDKKITCLAKDTNALFYTVDELLGNYIERYSFSSQVTRKVTSDAGASLCPQGNYIYYVNVDKLNTSLYGNGIYRANGNPSVDSNDSGTKIIGEEGEIYTSLTVSSSVLAYYKVNTQMLCKNTILGTGEEEILKDFVAPEVTPVSTGSKVQSYRDSIYFMDLHNDKALYEYDTVRKTFARITANKVSDFAIIGDMLYYNEVSCGVNNDLYGVHLTDGGEPALVSENDCVDIITDGTDLYYVEQNAAGVRTAIHKIDGDGNDTMLYTKGANCLTYYDGAIYFEDGGKLYKIATVGADTTATVVYEDKKVDVFAVSDGVVYFRELYGVGLKRLSRVNIDGTGYTVMMTDATDPASLQVVGDKIYYYSDTTTGTQDGIYAISKTAEDGSPAPTLICKRNNADGKKYYAKTFTVAGEYVYFIDYLNQVTGDAHLYRVRINGGTPEKIA